MSQIIRENSRNTKENGVMSPASDVLEMQELCGGIAAQLTRTGQVKDRIAVILDVFRPRKNAPPLITENRAYEFLSGKARRIESWEKDHARQVRATLERAEQSRKDAEHLDWLATQVGRLRATGEEFHGPHVDALEHLLRRAGGVVGPSAVSPEDEDQSRAWG